MIRTAAEDRRPGARKRPTQSPDSRAVRTLTRRLVVLVAGLALAGAASASCPYGELNPQAPAETAQFAFLVGEWACQLRLMGPDGSLGEPRAATWTGRYILDGWAIQDTWTTQDAEGRPSLGTNLRSFDRSLGKWHNRWLSSGSLEWLYFEAEAQGDRMVMIGEERKDARGRTFIARNVFHDIGESSWKWRQDRSFDGGATWFEGVAVIEASLVDGCRSPGPESRR